MQHYALIGYPLGHSFSARFFAEKFAKEGLDARYDNWEMASVEGLRAQIASDPDLCGLNVTIPHKQAVIALLDDLSDEARAIGAVNVIEVQRPAAAVEAAGTTYAPLRLVGHNTDIIGFVESIRPLLLPHHTKALVLGTGGASKAIVHGLRQLGILPTYVSRTRREGGLAYTDLTPEVMADHKVIVNCSPVGMFPAVDDAPAIPYARLTPDHLLYDLVYNPLDTRFMQLGREHGAVVKNGLEMLHRQALAAWRIWNNNLSTIVP